MNTHLEITLRLIGIFISVFFTYRWTIKSPPNYDVQLGVAVIVLALFSNHYGPLKMKN